MGSNPARSATKYGPDDEFVVLLRTVELRSERRLSPPGWTVPEESWKSEPANALSKAILWALLGFSSE